MTPSAAQSRVAIIGVGNVGAAIAYALVTAGHTRDVVLVDTDLRRAEGQLLDLKHCIPWARPVRFTLVGEAAHCEGCDTIVITAGARGRPGETRLDLLARNAAIFKTLIPTLVSRNSRATLLIISNPVDVMTRLAWKLSGLPAERVFGTGTVLDSARFRQALSEHFDIDAHNIHAYVVGEHGDSEVVVWSRAMIGPYSVEEYAARAGRPLSADDRIGISDGVRKAAYEIIARKGSTSFAIAATTMRILESMQGDLRTIQTVTRPLGGAYGHADLCMSLPCIIGRDGAAAPMEFPLAPDELAALHRSAEVLEKAYASLGIA